jgi:hypothetical protein
MTEVFAHPEHAAFWRAALRGETNDWDSVLGGYVAAVDWPPAALWRELSEAYPDAIVVLSMRESPETWWRSADATVLGAGRSEEDWPQFGEWKQLFLELLRSQLGEGWDDPETAKRAYELSLESVRATAPATRLVEWKPHDGWGPLCAALDVSVPALPFPHTNTTEDFQRAAPVLARLDQNVR